MDACSKTPGQPLAEWLKPKTMPICPACGSNSQVWRNQITGALTCHRLSCHGAIEKPKQTP